MGRGERSLRVLGLLEALFGEGRAAPLDRLAAASGLPRTTVHRLLHQLQAEGHLRLDAVSGRIEPGPRLLALAHRILASDGAVSLRRVVLTRLARELGETCNMTVPDGDAMVYLDRVETDWPLRIALPPGSRVPLHCTASGKLYLASLDAGSRAALVRALPRERRTPRTLTDPEALEAELARIRARGYSTDDEEFLQGMVAVAVPILDRDGRLLATLAVHGPSARMPLAEALAALPRLRRAADEMRALLLPRAETESAACSASER